MLPKTCLSLLISALLLPALGAQTPALDSLKQCFVKADNDSARWYYALELSAKSYRTNTDTAIHWGTLALAFARKSHNPRHEAAALSTIGVCYYYQGDYEKTFDYYFQSLKKAQESGNPKSASTTLGNIGLLYAERNEYEKALEYLHQALAQKISLQDSVGIARNYANIGMVFSNRVMPDSALPYYLKQVELCERLGEKFGKAIGLNNIGQVYLEKKLYEQALDYFQQSLAIKETLDDKNGMAVTLTNIAETWLNQGKPRQAVGPVERAHRLATEANSFPQLVKPRQLLAQAYAETGNFEKAYQYQKLLQEAIDTLNRKEALDRAEELEAKYKNEQQKSELAHKQLELERQTGQKKIILIGAIAALLTLGGGFQFVRNKQRIRQKEVEHAAQLKHTEAEKLREMDAMKTAFFANVSHEFRTPLTLIIGPLRQLLDQPGSQPNPSLYRTMLLSAERLLDLVNQLLDLTKAEAGKLELQPTETDLLPVLRGVAGSFTSLADVRQIRFETSMPRGELVARFDKDKLSKIVANLLSNAFKFTPEEGTVRLEAGIASGQNHEKELILTVRDTGFGIDAEEIPFIFERFYRAGEARRTEVAGTGIGLALTKELVELHGGSIGVKSQPGQGTEFTVRLPVLTGVAVTPDLQEEVLSGATFEAISISSVPLDKMLSSTSSNAQLLIVEDNPDVRLFIKDCLDWEYQILFAQDGAEGLETARDTVPDLIISDVMMPRMNGFELCRELKTDDRTSHIPVVMLTARAELNDKMAGLTIGADDYLVKPFDAGELQARVANLLSQRKKLQEHYRRSLTFATSIPLEAESVDAVFLRKVKETVEAHLDDENFSVVELSAQVSMSRSQLHRKLSALTGFSPNQIIRNMRLERAKQLLEARAGNASEVAFMTGFNSPAYFAKCFKDYFGRSPSEV